MVSREGDTAIWLHNKLGSTDDLWSGRSICSQITKEKLQGIIDCFYGLHPSVKVKLMLSFLHIVKRNVDEWKLELEEIIDLAVNDRDQWVSTVGEIMRTYPSTFLLNTNLASNSTFHTMYSELKKAVKKPTDSSALPLECACLGKQALASAVGTIPSSVKHFALKRKPKSAALRAELLSKSQEAQSQSKKGHTPGSVPTKVRSTAKRMDEALAAGPVKSSPRLGASGFLKANTLSSFSSRHVPSTSSLRKEGGAKVLDISEMPPTGKEAKRRKRMEEIEAASQAKKEKEAAAAAAASAAAAKATPDYAAGLGNQGGIKVAGPTPVRSVANIAPSTVPSYMPSVTPQLPATIQEIHHGFRYYHMRPYLPAGYRDVPTPIMTNHPAGPRPPVQSITPTIQIQKMRAPTAAPYQPRAGTPRPGAPRLGTLVAPAPTIRAPTPPQPIPPQQPISVQPSASQAPAQQQKKGLSLTREQMMEAQEMFKTSNRVTRPEKALILGFMAGSRDNPCPQQGHIVNIRLSEGVESVEQPNGSIKEMTSESFFQMNYATGEWKRIKKNRIMTQPGGK